MKNIIKIGIILSVLAMAMWSCGNGPEPTVEPTVLTLVPDKTEIEPNGVDAVTFTIKHGDEDVTQYASIKYASNDINLEGKSFTSEAEGEYGFYASYGNKKSAVVVITVSEAVNPVGLVMIASKSRLLPDGADAATLTVKYHDEVVTTGVKVLNQTTNEYLEANDGVFTVTTNDFFFSTPFVAEYEGERSEPLTLVAREFFKSIGVIKFSANWCEKCHFQTDVYNEILQEMPDCISYVAVHYQDTENEIPAGTEIARQYPGMTGLPYCVFDLDNTIQGTPDPKSKIMKDWRDRIKAYPATATIKTSSEVEGTTATVEIEVLSNTNTEYSIGIMLMENNVHDQRYDLTLSHMLRAVGTETAGVNGDSLGTIPVGETAKKTYSFDLSNCDNIDNCEYFIYVNNSVYKDKVTTTNSVQAPIRGGVDFRYAE